MASRSLGTLTLDLIAKIGGFTSGMTQAERIAQSRTRSIERSFTRMRNSIAGVFAFIGGASLVRTIVKNTADAENELAQLEAVLRSTGQAAGYNADQLTRMSDQLSQASTFSGGEITNAQTRLLAYTNIVGEQYPRALQAVIDQSARLGISITQSAEIIGRALDTPTKGFAALSRQGFQFGEDQKALIGSLERVGRTAEAQGIILDALENSYGGAAAAARDTFGGALAGLRNSFNDLLEAKGGLPDAVDNINQLSSLISDPSFVANVNTLTSAIISGFGDAARVIADVTGTFKFLGEELAARRFGPASDDVVRLDDAILRLEKDAKRIRDEGGILTFLRGGEEMRANALATIEKEIQDYQKLIDAARAPTSSVPAIAPSAGSGGSVVAPPSEEFLKIESALLRQIALYGKTGEAAKIAYDIQSGALDELAPKEQQRILALARQLDSLGKTAEITFAQLQELFDPDSRLILAMQDSATEIRGAINEFLAETGTSYEDVTAVLLEATESAVADVEKMFKGANEFYLEAARGTQNIIADTLFGAMEGQITDIEDAFVGMINRLVAESLAAQLATKLFGDPGTGGGGGWLDTLFGKLGGFFGGGRAAGGATNSGMLYRVNEIGTEALRIPGRQDYLMMGRQGGQVIPANRTGGAASVTQNIVVQGHVDARTARQLEVDAARRQRIATASLA